MRTEAGVVAQRSRRGTASTAVAAAEDKAEKHCDDQNREHAKGK